MAKIDGDSGLWITVHGSTVEATKFRAWIFPSAGILRDACDLFKSHSYIFRYRRKLLQYIYTRNREFYIKSSKITNKRKNSTQYDESFYEISIQILIISKNILLQLN